eukprot:15456728-Alexandrium_andersonii.AAC.1
MNCLRLSEDRGVATGWRQLLCVSVDAVSASSPLFCERSRAADKGLRTPEAMPPAPLLCPSGSAMPEGGAPSHKRA